MPTGGGFDPAGPATAETLSFAWVKARADGPVLSKILIRSPTVATLTVICARPLDGTATLSVPGSRHG